jgi:AAA domain
MSLDDEPTRVNANANGHSATQDDDFLDDPYGTLDGDHDSPESSWTVVDMAASLSSEPILPGLGARSDGQHLIYRGRVHWVFGTYESGKTWLCLHLTAQVLTEGGTALYVDFEDNARTIGFRLLQLGVPESVLKDPTRFAYIRPEVSLRHERERIAFDHSLSRTFKIAVIDGVTEAIALEGLKDNVGGDIALWQSLLPRKIAHHTGAAVLCIDHVPKDQDNRVMPIGSQHKMNGLDGAAFKILRHEPFGRGLVGKALVRVGKDRHGGVRSIGINYDPTDNTHLVGEFVLDATTYKASIDVPLGTDSTSQAESSSERLRWCMEKISIHLEGDLTDTARSQARILERMQQQVKGKDRKPVGKDVWRSALRALIEANFAYWIDGPRNSTVHFIVEPYRATNRDAPKDVSRRGLLITRAKAQRELDQTQVAIQEIDQRGDQ